MYELKKEGKKIFVGFIICEVSKFNIFLTRIQREKN